MNDWLQQLRQRLSSTKAVIQSAEGTRIMDLQDQGNLWVVGRDYCVFRRLDVAMVPAAKIEQALKNQVAVEAPYREPGFWYSVNGGIASTWIWDEAVRRELAAECGIDTEDFLVVPESCFTGADSGVAVYKAQGQGFYAQLQGDKGVEAETWWPDLPTTQAWRSFTRGAGAGGVALPDAVEIDLASATPWASVRVNAVATRSLERLAWQASLLLFVFLFSFQATGTIRLVVEAQRSASEVAALEDRYKSSLAIREEAFRLRSEARQLMSLRREEQLDLLNEVSESLPDSSFALRSWEFQNGQLEIVVADEAPDLEAYVRSIESIDALSGVSVEPDQSGQIKVTARL